MCRCRSKAAYSQEARPEPALQLRRADALVFTQRARPRALEQDVRYELLRPDVEQRQATLRRPQARRGPRGAGDVVRLIAPYVVQLENDGGTQHDQQAQPAHNASVTG
jgi:hypothetical protein